MKKLGVIIPAGGMSTRMGGAWVQVNGKWAIFESKSAPKQFMLLAGVPVLTRTIGAFAGIAAEIVVALPKEHVETWHGLCKKHKTPPHKVCVGGATRFESVRNALAELADDCDYIAVHDAARPLVSPELIERTLETAERHGAAIPAVELTDTIRRVDKNGESHSEDRASLRAVQTPQIFRAEILRTGYQKAVGNDFTDDASVVRAAGYAITLCRGERQNLKITEPVDLTIAEAILKNDDKI